MPAPDRTDAPSPFHDGEREIQRMLGVSERMEAFARRVVRDHLPEQHRAFFAQLPFIVAASVDADGAPWVTLLEGEPGFMRSPDPRHLRIDALAAADDPAAAGMRAGDALGLLGIELHSRRRNRMNGRILDDDSAGMAVEVEHSFGNCPQYIQTRGFRFAHPPQAKLAGSVQRATTLDAAARALIAAADTLFVASYLDIDGDAAARQVDASHRGGKPGFVRIDGDTLTIPDFAGNLHFNTLGNLLRNPRAGLLFVDFDNGDALQLSGRVEIVFDGDEVRSFQGAERLWRFTVEQVVRRAGAFALRFEFGEFSPNVLMTGSWDEAAARQRAEALRMAWRPFRVARIDDESSTIRSFHLEPADGAGYAVYQAGQHLPIRVTVGDDAQPTLRTYTLSSAPADGVYRISVKRQGKVSMHLHDHMKVGDVVEVRAPAGDFTIDAGVQRPVVLLSGGVGATPMLAMLRHLVYEGRRRRGMRPAWYIHSSRTLPERPFDRELAELVSASGGRAFVVQALSEPGDAKPGRDYQNHGFIDAALLKSVLPFDDYDFYLCGPPAFMQSLYDQLRDLRVGDDRIHAEAFGPASLKRRPDAGVVIEALPAAAIDSVPVLFARSAKEALWSPQDGSLLELAEARGLAPEYSCRGGSCGTCRTGVSEGQVTYAEVPGATHAPGEALICCAVPAAGTARIVLDL